ncbi:MAG: flavodoxin family protein [Lachnospiraceae bacterium]|nr:flavodoxin family protein [Lachnospiraceae bacterium]
MSKGSVLAILGGPHKNGMTASMLDISVKAAENAGYSVKRADLYDMNIDFCKGCNVCNTTGTCIVEDDIQDIAESLKKCDIIILAAPVYWANVPAAVKNLFDRLTGTAMEKTSGFPKARLAGKKYIILTSCDTPAPFSWIFGQSRGAIRAMDEFFKTAGMTPLQKVVVSGRPNKTGVPENIVRKLEGCWR